MPAKLPGWIQRPEILSYIVDSYAGLETNNGGPKRRVFVWEDGTEIKMGNCEAFLLHLITKFGLVISARATSSIHALLSQLGERVREHKTHEFHGKSPAFKQPEPDEWVIGVVSDE